MENLSQPIIFNFVGCFLKESSFSQKDASERKIDRFELKVQPIDIHSGKNNFDITLHIFSDGFESLYAYTCLFEVKTGNSTKFTPKISEDCQRNMLAVAFPFVRQAISSSTNDFLHPVLLPVIDIRTLPVFSGVSFVRSDLQDKAKTKGKLPNSK
jgi:preprotein translocase subunit SecB